MCTGEVKTYKHTTLIMLFDESGCCANRTYGVAGVVTRCYKNN